MGFGACSSYPRVWKFGRNQYPLSPLTLCCFLAYPGLVQISREFIHQSSCVCSQAEMEVVEQMYNPASHICSFYSPPNYSSVGFVYCRGENLGVISLTSFTIAKVIDGAVFKGGWSFEKAWVEQFSFPLDSGENRTQFSKTCGLTALTNLLMLDGHLRSVFIGEPFVAWNRVFDSLGKTSFRLCCPTKNHGALG